MILHRYILAVICCLGFALMLHAEGAASPTLVPSAPDVLVFNGVAVIPLDPLVDLLGLTFTFDDRAAAITFARNGRSFTCSEKNTKGKDNGVDILLPLKPFGCGTGFYVPLEPFVKALGGTVEKNEGEKTARISLPALDPPLLCAWKLQPGEAGHYHPRLAQLNVIGVDGSDMRLLTFTDCAQILPAFSHDGKMIVLVSDEAVTVRACNHASGTTVLKRPHLLAASFTPDDGSVICDVQREEKKGKHNSALIRSLRVRTDGSEPKELPGAWAAISADGTTACAVYNAKTNFSDILLTDGKGDKMRTIENSERPAFSLDGTRLLYFCRNANAAADALAVLPAVLRMAGDEKPIVLPEAQKYGQITDCRFAPDGKYFLFSSTSEQAEACGLYRADLDFTNIQRLATGNVSRFDCSPDGTLIALSRPLDPDANKQEHWDIELLKIAGGETHKLLGHIPYPGAVFTPDGKQLIFRMVAE